MNENLWGTRESVAAAAPCFGSREDLIEALGEKAWAIFLARDGKLVLGAPKGDPDPEGCPCCSGVEAARLDGEGILLTGGCTIVAPSAMWGEGPQDERGFIIEHQGAHPELDGIVVITDYIPTPQEAEEIVWKAARRERQ